MSSNAATILLVEDEPTLLTLYRLALSHVGTIVTATTVQEALKTIEQANQAALFPTVILLDLLLPTTIGEHVNYDERGGFVLLKHIRSIKPMQQIPVFVMTNLDSFEDRKQATELGATGYIVKSNVVPSDIIREIQPYL